MIRDIKLDISDGDPKRFTIQFFIKFQKKPVECTICADDSIKTVLLSLLDLIEDFILFDKS